MLDFLKKRPMLLCALAASVISVISFYSETALFILALCILGLIFLLAYKRIRGELIFAAILILAIVISAFLNAAKANTLRAYSGSDCIGEFVVIEEPENHGEFYSTVIETVKSDVLGKGEKLLVSYNDGKLEFSQKIKARLSLSVSDEAKYRKMDYSSGIFIRGYIKEFEQTGKKDSILSVVGSVRDYIKTTVFKNYNPDTAATVMALVAGNRTYLSDRFYGNVKGAGVAHVMVVSGMHLSVIVSLFLYLTNKFFYNRYIRALTILFVTVAVMTICGFTMSIQRAGITYILVALGLVLDRESTPENTLGLAVSIILLINSFAIFNVAFQLSVLSTFAILVVAVPVTEFVADKGIIKSKLLLGIFSSVLISISALVFTAPVTIYVFGYLSTVSVITNLLIATPVSMAMVLCILGFLLPLLASFFFGVSEKITVYINAVINNWGSRPYSVVIMPEWTVILFVILIIIILWALLACKVRSDMLKSKEIRLKKVKEGGKGINGSNFGAGIKKRN